jgi:hypothetical protein
MVRVRDVAKPAALKIVGLPDEIVEANESGVYIDDVAVTGFSREFLTRNRLGRQYIPVDHYFVMGEQRVNQDISEYWGIHPEARLESVRSSAGRSAEVGMRFSQCDWWLHLPQRDEALTFVLKTGRCAQAPSDWSMCA